MGIDRLLANCKPQILVKEIKDLYLRKNFDNLLSYFQTQNQLLDYKFYDVTFAAAEENKLVAHGLGFKPEDVIVTKIYGSVKINYGLFDTENVNLSSLGPARIRFYVGKYWNSEAAPTPATDYQLVASGSATTTEAASSTSTSSVFLPAPVSLTFLANGTAFNCFAFKVTSASVTVGDIYFHNRVEYTIAETVIAGSVVTAYGVAAPLTTGSLSKRSGSGDSTIAFTDSKAPSYLEVEGVGGGGGGQGGGAPTPPNGGVGGATTFGSIITWSPGSGGDLAGGSPGAMSVVAPAIAIVYGAGNRGQGFFANNGASAGCFGTGGVGGASPFGGSGLGMANSPGLDATANSGAGGGGGGFLAAAAARYSGGGGPSGGYGKAKVPPAASYAIVIGTAGGNGGAGGGGYAGGIGGSGRVVVRYIFQ